MSNNAKVGVVILAAGEGKRMQSDWPKVMHLLNGKPLIEYVVQAVEKAGVTANPVVVVSVTGQEVQNYLGERVIFVVQAEQLGTGHAVATAEDILKNEADTVVVLYGDMPFVSPASIRHLLEEHTAKRNVLTMLTTTVPDFAGESSQFKDFGRIVRDTSGQLKRIAEARDASAEEKKIKELNTGFFCYDAPWLWSHLKLIRNSNAQGEYYLTDLVALAISGGYPVSSILVDAQEAVGVNTKEQLEKLHSL